MSKIENKQSEAILRSHSAEDGFLVELSSGLVEVPARLVEFE